ncbi:hypothetical protein [Cupriavidus necator]
MLAASATARCAGGSANAFAAAWTHANPGGLAKDLGDVPKEPDTAGGLPGRDKPKPSSESAGKADRDGLHDKPRKGTGGASIDRTRVPDAKGR